MAQRHIEVLVGRLITDESFRETFLEDPQAALQGFAACGHELTAVERG